MLQDQETDTAPTEVPVTDASPEVVQDPAEALREAADKAAQSAEELEAASEEVTSLLDALGGLAGTGVADWVYLGAIFALACFVGYYVVWSVTPALHTPLMSVTNAISSVVIVGALIAVGADMAAGSSGTSRFLGIIAVALASVNIFGGFMVTQRMLAMYKKKER